jgi:hypothetical protein
MYYEFTAGNDEYKLRLNMRNAVSLEKKLGCNPLMIFGDGSTIPPIEQMVQILHASLQQNHHGITLDKTYDIFDSYLADGHSVTDFIYVIVEVFKVSGIIRNDEETELEKN